jgi:hypothetical protein
VVERRLLLQHPVHAPAAAVLLRLAGLDQSRHNAGTDPLSGAVGSTIPFSPSPPSSPISSTLVEAIFRSSAAPAVSFSTATYCR